MYKLESWPGTKISPSPRAWAVQPEEVEPLARKAREAGFTVAIQPIWTIDPSVEPEMLPTHNPWWTMFAHTSQETWKAWTEILEEMSAIAERTGAQYLVCLHESDCLLPYPGWEDFIENVLRKRAGSVKLIYSQHSMQHLRLFYEPLVELGILAVSLAHTDGDMDLAAARVFEMIGQRSVLPNLRLPNDVARQRQLGRDLRAGWVKHQSAEDVEAGRYPYLELVRERFDAYKSSDYWPPARAGKTKEEIISLYRRVPFNPLPGLPGMKDVYYIDFAAAQRGTRELFGGEKIWFTETGLVEPALAEKDKPVMYPLFIKATREAWTGISDCIVWWGTGYDRDFIAVMENLSEREGDEEARRARTGAASP